MIANINKNKERQKFAPIYKKPKPEFYFDNGNPEQMGLFMKQRRKKK